MNEKETPPSFLGQSIGNIEQDCPELHINEWLLICDILNSYCRCPELSSCLAEELLNSVFVDTGAKWAVDLSAFSRRISTMSHEERCAVIEVVEQFWKHPQRHNGESEVALQSIGARFPH